MKRAVVKLEVYVTVEVPDHVYERDKEDSEMSEEDIWHDYASSAINRHMQAREGKTDDDWIELWAEIFEHEIDEGPEDVDE